MLQNETKVQRPATVFHKNNHIIKVQVKNMRLSYVLLKKVLVRLHRSDMFGTCEAATLNDHCISWCDGEGSGGAGAPFLPVIL